VARSLGGAPLRRSGSFLQFPAKYVSPFNRSIRPQCCSVCRYPALPCEVPFEMGNWCVLRIIVFRGHANIG
jgi:hypothetical protein